MKTYTIIRSRRRTVALEITRDGRVLVRAPYRFPEDSAADFVSRHADWIAKHLEQQRRLALTAPPEPTAEEIAALKARAREILPGRVAHFSARMGLTPTGVKVTSARRRYGSCSGKNSLCFSCFLMRSPMEAIDAVVVHELAHIRYKNHGPEFYALVESILPDYRTRKALLQ